MHNNMTTQSQMKIDTQMLIRKHLPQVFETFVNPDITTKFWFTKSSGRLEQGKTVRWDWEIYPTFRTKSRYFKFRVIF